MLVKTAGLLLAGLSFANAGIFQRQSECYPSTVTITAVPAPASPVVTETTTLTLASAPQTIELDTTSTIVSVVTETTTVTPPPFTITSTLTNFVTVQPSTVYQTITGLSSVSSIAQASESAPAVPTITYTSVLTNFITVPHFTSTVYRTVESLASTSSLAALSTPSDIASPEPFGGAEDTATPAGTAFSSQSKSIIIQTMTVVPVPAVQSEHGTDQMLSVPLSSPTEVSAAAPTSTSTVSLTSTDVVVTTLTVVPIPVPTTSNFPTLTVSGTMGITPSGNGPATSGSSAFGTSIGTARSGTGLPFISASAPAAVAPSVALPPISAPPFANTTVSGGAAAATSSFPVGTNATVASTGSLARRDRVPAKREFELKNRQVGSIVTATIDGVIVSWTNTWDGAAPTTTVAPPNTPIVVTATIGGVIVSWTQTIEGNPAPGPMTTSTSTTTPAPVAITTADGVSFTHGPGGPVTIGPIPLETLPSSSASTSVPIPSISAVGPAALSLSISANSSSVYSPSGPPAYTAPLSVTSGIPTIRTPTPVELPSTTPFPSLFSSAGASDISVSSVVATYSSTTSATSSLSSTSSSSLATQSATATNSSTISTLTSITSTTSTASASATCTGQFTSSFTVDFDDLPLNGEPPSSRDYPPFRNPYNGLYWSQGFSYAPPPSDPYPPHSGSQLGMFVVDGSANIHSLNWTGPVPNDTDVNGMFGAGPNFADPAFYIDAFGAWVGCQNTGPERCQVQVNGYTLLEPSGELGLEAQQYFYQDSCTSDCALQYLELSQDFRNLTAFQIQATIEGDSTPITWYVDDIGLAWTDNSCDAIQARSGATGALGFGGFVKRGGTEADHELITWQSHVPVARGH